MEHLSAVLKEHQIASAPLEILFEAAQEKSYVLLCEGATAFSRWQHLRGLVAQTGYWPVILGSRFDLEDVRQHFDSSIQHNWYGSRSTSTLLYESQTIDTTKWTEGVDVEQTLAWYEQERNRMAQEGIEDEEDLWIPDPLEGFLEQLSGWAVLGLFPTTHCWEVPALLRFGDFNACPGPGTHISILKHWSEKYGLELVSMSRCDWLAFVGHPPHARTDALVLSREHIEYCPEFVVDTRCHGNIEALASWLLRTTYWSFWWD